MVRYAGAAHRPENYAYFRTRRLNSSAMNVLYPKIELKHLRMMLGVSLCGGMLGGVYGSVHDQVTYSISPEYFTRLKFAQFHYLDFGFSDRVLVAEIGFVSAGAMGLLAGWFLSRIALPKWDELVAVRKCLVDLCVVFLFAMLATPAGYVLGRVVFQDTEWLRSICQSLGVVERADFIAVACIHYASYAGGLLGLVVAFVMMRKQTSP